jgi:predicted nucleic acid-binding protein
LQAADTAGGGKQICPLCTQCSRDRKQQHLIKQFLADLNFTVLPLTESIGRRALIYIEEYGISSGLRAGDALIAATAAENNLSLASGNARHFRALHDLALKVFKP